MAAIVTNAGERSVLATWFASVGALRVMLIKSDFVPGPEVVFSALAEADFNGYGRQELSSAGVEPGNPGGRAVLNFEPLVFSADDDERPNQIFGWAVLDGDDNVLVLERFTGTARQLVRAGATVEIHPSIRLWAPV